MFAECSMLKEQSKNYTKGLEDHTYIVVTTSFMLLAIFRVWRLPKHETSSYNNISVVFQTFCVVFTTTAAKLMLYAASITWKEVLFKAI